MSEASRRLLDTGAVAEELNLSISTLNKWRVTGQGPPYVKLGRNVAYEPSALTEWIAQKRRRSTSDQPNT